MKQLNAEWVTWIGAYRLYDPKNPHDAFAYADNIHEAEQYALENGYDRIVECDADTMYVEHW